MSNIKANSNEWIDKKYGKLTVIGFEHKNSRWMWKCKCECGKVSIVYPNQVLRGKTTTCGCGRSKTFHDMHLKHGFSGERLYKIWKGMRKRCNNPNAVGHEHYKDRGIRVCKEWDEYPAFREWAISNGYKENLSIERIDVDGDYCPENCIWIPLARQADNTTATIKVIIDGVEKPLGQWADEYGIKRTTVYSRVRRGKNPLQALNIE